MKTPSRFAYMRPLGACAVLVVLSLAAYWTLRLGYADRLFHSGTPAAILIARRLAPANAAYFTTTPGDRSALEEAIKHNPRYSSGWIELGLAAELNGDLARAERCLLEAARVDRTYEPRWTLANYYFRRGDRDRFWYWASQAARMAYADQTPLFLLCWRMTQDPEVILKRAIPDRREILEQYLNFLILQQKLEEALPVGERLVASGAPQALPLLFGYCDRLLQAGRAPAALELWNTLCYRRVIARQALSPRQGQSLTNGDFSAAPLGAGFDWRLQATEGVSFARLQAPPQLRVMFSGRQPETCRVVEQVVPLEPSRGYRLRYRYRTSGVRPKSGLYWQLSSLTGDNAWSAATADLSSEEWTQGELEFTTPPDAGAFRLSLRYERALGTTRIEGSLWLRDVSLRFR